MASLSSGDHRQSAHPDIKTNGNAELARLTTVRRTRDFPSAELMALLSLKSLSKTYGALVVTDALSLDVAVWRDTGASSVRTAQARRPCST